MIPVRSDTGPSTGGVGGLFWEVQTTAGFGVHQNFVYGLACLAGWGLRRGTWVQSHFIIWSYERGVKPRKSSFVDAVVSKTNAVTSSADICCHTNCQLIVRSADEKYKTNCLLHSTFNNQLDLFSIQSENRGHFSYLLFLTFSVWNISYYADIFHKRALLTYCGVDIVVKI